MAVATAIDFQAEAKRLWDLFDRLEMDEMKEMFADDFQGVDELSRKWMRGKSAIEDYMKQLQEMGIGDIQSKLSDMATKHWDDIALVTCMADQTYSLGGEQVTITAPVSVLFRYINGDWKIEMVQAVPLSEEG